MNIQLGRAIRAPRLGIRGLIISVCIALVGAVHGDAVRAIGDGACTPAPGGHSVPKRVARLTLGSTRGWTASGTIELRTREGDGAWSPEQSMELTDPGLEPILQRILTRVGSPAPGIVEGEGAGFEVGAKLRDGGFSNPNGTALAEGLGGDLVARLERDEDAWRFQLKVSFTAGEAYLDPIYIDLGDAPITLRATGSWSPQSRLIALDDVRYVHRDMLDAAASVAAILRDDCLDVLELDLNVPRFDLARGYETYIRPFLIGSGVDAIEGVEGVEGVADFRGRWRGDGRPDVELRLEDIGFLDSASTTRIVGLSGEAHWLATGGTRRTRLQWDHMTFGGITMEAGDLEGSLVGSNFDLGEPVRIPVFGGEFRVGRISADFQGSTPTRWRISATVEGVDLVQLSSRFGWGGIEGALSAPSLELSFGRGGVRVRGELSATVFGGRFHVDRLLVDDMLGIFPLVTFDVRGSDLSLRMVTSAMPQLGGISGRVDVYGQDLRFEAGDLVAGEFRINSSANDPEARWISARTLESLALISGLSTFKAPWQLRIFPNLRYDRLGMNCALKDGVCEMTGLEADGGPSLYLIAGTGLPPTITVRLPSDESQVLVDFDTLRDRAVLHSVSEEGLVLHTDAVVSLVQSMKARFPRLLPHYCNGSIGLTATGTVALRTVDSESGGSVDRESREALQVLVQEENADRESLYAEIARASGAAEWEDKLREVFARRWVELAGEDWWYQGRQGWKRKIGVTPRNRCEGLKSGQGKDRETG